ncbi:MAG: hypothetical protein IJQ36_01045 [Oscillospiraceae bacterium]|nr:hypothetical protein [Oscillospiraceae bacterium]
MLDANDIQIISKIVSDALAEERKHTEAMFAEERKHTEAMLAEQNKELHGEMTAMFAEERKRTDEKLDSLRQQMHEDMMTIVESEINPKLRILAEGHEALLERMTPPEEIANMKADIVVLKEAVRSLSMKVNALQKAQ